MTKAYGNESEFEKVEEGWQLASNSVPSGPPTGTRVQITSKENGRAALEVY